MTLFAGEEHDPNLNYMVYIEGSKDRKTWVRISKAMTANEALDKADELHKEWRYLRFDTITN